LGFKPKLFAETGGGCRVDATRSPRAAEAARQPGAVCALVGELPQLGGWDPKKAPWHPVAMKVGWLYQEFWVDFTSNLMIYRNVGIELGYTGRKLGRCCVNLWVRIRVSYWFSMA